MNVDFSPGVHGVGGHLDDFHGGIGKIQGDAHFGEGRGFDKIETARYSRTAFVTFISKRETCNVGQPRVLHAVDEVNGVQGRGAVEGSDDTTTRVAGKAELVAQSWRPRRFVYGLSSLAGRL